MPPSKCPVAGDSVPIRRRAGPRTRAIVAYLPCRYVDVGILHLGFLDQEHRSFVLPFPSFSFLSSSPGQSGTIHCKPDRLIQVVHTHESGVGA